MTPAMQALAPALVLSLGCNAGLGWAWLHARDAATRTLGERDSARADASACSDGVADLRDLADERHRVAKAAQAAAAERRRQQEAMAQLILSTPAVPGDVCASAQARVDSWIRGRVAP
ncbi:hypothetical protein [Pseudacidovorax sp. RU35E]|uniref:hypothetical protein n=1 Tax=Pseudacidovorax sp. RU35E TaxID=1907403 RepID=UPI0009565CBB|nr:hypothetical protein [Pseudacidovorax sp. RU35E]SIQ01390.1 hypothetical protein SAMN05880557_101518 [Pseudacidovorax sp. RU35E]